MDPLLLERYSVLLAAYANGEPGLIQELKKGVISEFEMRPDAMLCLLVLFEEMILKPYSGNLYRSGKPQPVGLAVPQIAQKPEDFDSRVRRSYNIIVSKLKDLAGSEPASSHQVLLAITATWPELSEQLDWA